MNDINLRRLLLKLGISSNLQGYLFIIDCVDILSKQQIHTRLVSLYEKVGKKYNKNASIIERNIRHAKEKAWKSGTLKLIYSTIPDNSEFLYDLYFNFDVLECEFNRWIERGEL